MIMTETMTETFNSLCMKSKRTYKNQNDIYGNMSTISSNKSSVDSSTTNNNDWHRLLLSRLKPGITGKYRTKRKNTTSSDTISSTFVGDQTVTLQSYMDESLIITKSHMATITQSDALKPIDSSIETSVRRDSHYIKNSMSSRYSNTMTSLKRRVRKQQMKCTQNQPTPIQETTYEIPTSSNIVFIPYPEQTPSPRRYKSKKYSSVVQLPPLMNACRTAPTHIQDINLNIYGY